MARGKKDPGFEELLKIIILATVAITGITWIIKRIRRKRMIKKVKDAEQNTVYVIVDKKTKFKDGVVSYKYLLVDKQDMKYKRLTTDSDYSIGDSLVL